MSLKVLTQYWHTLRQLRPVQLYGRVWFRLYRPRPDCTLAPSLRVPTGSWQAPARRQPSLIGPDTFRFLAVEGSLTELDWDGPKRDKLWRYNQHYFDDLNSQDSAARTEWHRTLLLDWVARNPPGIGTGWEPYPTSRRIVNWIGWSMAGHTLPIECRQSLAVQARWLSQRLEFHLLGNHLLANAKALVYAGLFFEGGEAAGWLETGLRILGREVPEQILADGGHFELSTMYHALVLEDLLDLCNLCTVFSDALDESGYQQWMHWQTQVTRMIEWLCTMCHPDHEISFFNDAAFGIAPSPAELLEYTRRVLPTTASSVKMTQANPGCVRLEDSGYVRLALGDAVVLIDLAHVGPVYLPAHAHADTLSFEMSLGAKRVLVNSGTSCYGHGPERLRERGTAAHNTVVVNGEDSSEVWNGFRVARRARPFDVRLNSNDGRVFVEGAHDGYRRLVGRPTHRRKWLLGDGILEVIDTVEGPFIEAVSRFHLHPDVQIERQEMGAVLLCGELRIELEVSGGELRVLPDQWHPRFGLAVPNICLEIPLLANAENGSSSLTMRWRKV